MGKKEFVVRRVFQLVVLYLAIASMLFFLFRAAPGSPLATFIGTGFTQAQEEAIRESFGLNDPLWLQYLKFLKNALLFDFGLSYTTSKPVMQLVGERVWNTLVLMGSSVVLAYLFGVPFGAYLAWNR